MTKKFSVAGLIGVVAVVAAAMLVMAVSVVAAQEEKPYVIKNGEVDWYTYSGFRRYHSECHVCHGPDGLGSSFGPDLVESMKTLEYGEFLEIVAAGRQNVSQSNYKVMPAFGDNLNVVCFMDDIYAYLKARADGALGRGRPPHEPISEDARKRDKECLGQ